MKASLMTTAVAAAVMLGFSTAGSRAQVVIADGGGYYGFTDPTIAVTPFGIRTLGYGYNGYTGMGAPMNPDWQMLRSIYAQGYQDAMNAAAAQAAANAAAADTAEAPETTGMTATPRGAVGRVPHGSDSVRVRRAGGQIALRWQGDPRTVSSVTFELTDRAGRTLRRTTVDQLPAEVHFTPPAKAVYYQVIVHYVDGANNTIMSKLAR
jgi:hypothetical protein